MLVRAWIKRNTVISSPQQIIGVQTSRNHGHFRKALFSEEYRYLNGFIGENQI